MLPVPSVVEVNGISFDVRVKCVLVEQDSTTSGMGNSKSVFARHSCWRYSIAFWRAITYHVPAMCSSVARAPSRRGPGFQLRMLRRVCSSKRLGTLFSKQYFGFGECLLSWASRKMGLELPVLTKRRSSVAAGSDILHAVYPSRMDETSSPLPETTSSSECGKEQPFGCDPMLDGMDILRYNSFLRCWHVLRPNDQ